MDTGLRTDNSTGNGSGGATPGSGVGIVGIVGIVNLRLRSSHDEASRCLTHSLRSRYPAPCRYA